MSGSEFVSGRGKIRGLLLRNNYMICHYCLVTAGVCVFVCVCVIFYCFPGEKEYLQLLPAEN